MIQCISICRVGLNSPQRPTRIPATIVALSNLPSELILDITSWLEYDGHVNTVMQTSHQSHRLPRPYLYRHNVQSCRASALRWAVSNGVVSTVEKILEAGASPDHTFSSIPCDHTGRKYEDWGPVALATAIGHEPVVRFLLRRVPAPIQQDGFARPTSRSTKTKQGTFSTKENPLFWALAIGHESILRVLVTHAMKTLKEDQAIAKFYVENLRAVVNKTTSTTPKIF